jgi:hypothetical protein
MLNFAEQTGSGAVIVVWSFLVEKVILGIQNIIAIASNDGLSVTCLWYKPLAEPCKKKYSTVRRENNRRHGV